MAIYSTSSSAAGVRITASTPNSGHTILDGVALESTTAYVIQFSSFDGSLTIGGYAIANGGFYAVDIKDGAEDIIVNILESGHLFGGGILNVSSFELITVNFINAGNAYGNDTGYYGSSGVDKIINSGFLGTSGSTAINSINGEDQVYNSGTIQGHVLLGLDNDLYDGRGGTVIGEVQGGQGDDTYIVDDATVALIEIFGEGTDTVKATVSFRLGDNFENLTLLTHKNINGVGNSLDNTLTGNAGNNRLQGDQGNDLINGAHGDDKLLGSFGNDTLQGGKGDDILKGGLDNDLLQMGNGDDVGFGGKGNDTLEGVRGDDILKGGAGQDTMTGGYGDDVFLFTRKLHSTNAASDSITDFTSGEDLIDLSAFNGTFDFIGNTAFSGTAKEVRFFSVGSDRTVKIDIDGDGSTDMTILVNSATALVELDFVL